MKYFFIFGNHAELSFAELTTVLERKNCAFEILHQKNNFIIIETTTPLADNFLTKLGGSIKYGEIIKTIDQSRLVPTLFHLLSNHPSTGKFRFGLNSYNKDQNLTKIGLTLKNELKDNGLSCRFVTSREPNLSSVVIHKNKLDKEDGFDVNLFYLDGQIQIGRTLAVQNFTFYSNIDYNRPAFDNKAGMLPPKVAQIMLNLLTKESDRVRDPFCGSGTILMMAAFAGFKQINGSDIATQAVNRSTKNLNWLRERYALEFDSEINLHDAQELTTHIKKNSLPAIVTEPHLGTALSGNETAADLNKNTSTLTTLYQKIFRQFTEILSPDGEIIIVLPEIQIPRFQYQFKAEQLIPKSLQIIDSWIYSRPGQKVIRHIYKIKKRQLK